MLTFDELREPVAGWSMIEIKDSSTLDNRPYWTVRLCRHAGGGIVEGNSSDLQAAWDAAVRGAEGQETSRNLRQVAE